ncbi:14182_t:CDS:2, partial [Funneliformis mosseae]
MPSKLHAIIIIMPAKYHVVYKLSLESLSHSNVPPIPNASPKIAKHSVATPSDSANFCHLYHAITLPIALVVVRKITTDATIMIQCIIKNTINLMLCCLEGTVITFHTVQDFPINIIGEARFRLCARKHQAVTPKIMPENGQNPWDGHFDNLKKLDFNAKFHTHGTNSYHPYVPIGPRPIPMTLRNVKDAVLGSNLRVYNQHQVEIDAKVEAEFEINVDIEVKVGANAEVGIETKIE